MGNERNRGVNGPLVLASTSPRRRELLHGAGLKFSVRAVGIDETPFPGETPTTYVRRLSTEKAAASMESPLAGRADVVLAADTTVDVQGEIFEKPLDIDDAYRMLRTLSGRAHLVHTGVTVSVPIAGARRSSMILVTTEVRFAALDDESIEWYLESADAGSEWQDKAGAYGIQGAAAAFVERIEGSVTNVIGLPLTETLALLRQATGAATGESTGPA